MIILFDVGNTNITVGISDLEKINHVYRLKAQINKTADEYYFSLKQMINCPTVKAIIISSVVPELTRILVDISKHHFNIEPLVLGSGIKTGLLIKADNPKEVGADLIADAVAVSKYNRDTLVIDLGTATKYIYVSKNALKGVIICPGVFISIKALVNNTALLPDIDIKVPYKVLGTNTASCMQSGVTYGTACQVDGFIKRIKKETNNDDLLVIATGGLAKLIVPLCDSKIIEDDELTLKGILEIYKRNC